MAVAALVISLASLAATIIGLFLAYRQADKALKLTQKATANALWDWAIESVILLSAMDLGRQSLGDSLPRLRVRLTALATDLQDWDNLGEWLTHEYQQGVARGRLVMETIGPQDTIDGRLDKLEPWAVWCAGLMSNLRALRNSEYDENTRRAIDELSTRAREQTDRLYERRGWGEVPREIPGLEPLDEP